MESPHPPIATVHPITLGLAAGESPASAPARVDLPPDQLARVKRSEALLRIDQVEARVGFRKSKIYALAKDEPLLRPVRISARCVAWPESRIEAFIAKVIAQADDLAEQAARP